MAAPLLDNPALVCRLGREVLSTRQRVALARIVGMGAPLSIRRGRNTLYLVHPPRYRTSDPGLGPNLRNTGDRAATHLPRSTVVPSSAGGPLSHIPGHW